ncbi:glycosyltransferase family 2 protein [Microbacterium sp. G2-8]|uniref:glycosyltransferase family 2 protein n=1 Tax=Microbacterium sp. G2-8 TaxID=2842454 RepID=UPI001C8AC0AA|nr:glycosyltransferase family 2 protein [Microbacterium sp. G2-8]
MSDAEPTLSVVVPAYEQADTLAETMTSVLSQHDVDLELIVADHSSADDTYAVAERFAADPRVRLLHTPAGGGAAANWAAVTHEARSEYLKLLPGDDTVLPGSLARQVALLAQNPAAVLVAGRRRIIDDRGRTIAPRRGLQGLDARMRGEDAVRQAVRSGTNPFGEPGAVTMRRDALVAAGGWQGDWSYGIDVATYIAVLRHGHFVRDDGVASTFRVSSGQWSVALADRQAAEMADLFAHTSDAVDRVTPDDVRTGVNRARRMARMRRLVYRAMALAPRKGGRS